MKRYAILIGVGMLFGGIVVAWQTDSPIDGPPFPAVHAQQAPLRPPQTARRDANRLAPSPNRTRQLTADEQINIRVYEVSNASVVNINTSTVQYDRFFMLPIPGEGSGSGSVLDKQGHILTNYHVVEDAKQIEVSLANGDVYPAEMVGYDAETDIAVVRVDAPAAELHPIELGMSDDLKVGQRVYALGDPFGLKGTMTTGIISSLNRTPSDTGRRALKSLIQTDAAMNPGNSGGPLLDTSARMVGMNIAIASKTGQSAGVGFAIPVNRIRRIVPDLIKNGKITRPDHGIVSVMETSQGLKIVKLNEGGPAERAGLRGFRIVRRQRREGAFVVEERYVDRNHADYILSVNGQPTRTHNDFLDVIEKFKPGDEVTFTILRNGREMDVDVTLGAT